MERRRRRTKEFNASWEVWDIYFINIIPIIPIFEDPYMMLFHLLNFLYAEGDALPASFSVFMAL